MKNLIVILLCCVVAVSPFAQQRTVITYPIPPRNNDATTFLSGTYQWLVPAGGGGGGSAPVGTMVNTGTPAIGNVPKALDATGTNWGPSALSITDTNGSLTGNLLANGATFTNGITAGPSTFTGEVTSTLGTITADASVLDATATWNNAGVTFTSDKINITDTASAAASMLIDRQIGGTSKFSVQKGGLVTLQGTASAGSQAGYFVRVTGDSTSRAVLGLDSADNAIIAMGPGSGSRDTFLSRGGAANVWKIGVDSATATFGRLKAMDGLGTDKVGGPLELEDGTSTGTAKGGGLIFRTANSAGASASSLNTKSERFHAPAKWVTLTESTPTTIYTLPVPATNYVGFTATVTIYATDGTDHQSKTSVVTVDAIAKTTVITPTISQVDNTTAASSGTLTCTYTVTDNGSNVLALKADAASSLSQTVLRAKLVLTAINGSGTAAGTEQ